MAPRTKLFHYSIPRAGRGRGAAVRQGVHVLGDTRTIRTPPPPRPARRLTPCQRFPGTSWPGAVETGLPRPPAMGPVGSSPPPRAARPPAACKAALLTKANSSRRAAMVRGDAGPTLPGDRDGMGPPAHFGHRGEGGAGDVHALRFAPQLWAPPKESQQPLGCKHNRIFCNK